MPLSQTPELDSSTIQSHTMTHKLRNGAREKINFNSTVSQSASASAGWGGAKTLFGTTSEKKINNYSPKQCRPPTWTRRRTRETKLKICHLWSVGKFAPRHTTMPPLIERVSAWTVPWWFDNNRLPWKEVGGSWWISIAKLRGYTRTEKSKKTIDAFWHWITFVSGEWASLNNKK